MTVPYNVSQFLTDYVTLFLTDYMTVPYNVFLFLVDYVTLFLTD